MFNADVRRKLPIVSIVLSLLVVATASGGARAAASVSNGKLSCTVTAQAVTLSKTSLTAKATLTCTASTTASVSIGLVEMDGTTETALQTPKVVAVAVSKSGTSYTVSGTTITCVNTEAGNEEFASKAQVVLTTSTGSKVTSSWDLKIPANDAHAC